jgi:hypothetical protein
VGGGEAQDYHLVDMLGEVGYMKMAEILVTRLMRMDTVSRW